MCVCVFSAVYSYVLYLYYIVHTVVAYTQNACMYVYSNILSMVAGKVKTTGEIYKHKMQVIEGMPQQDPSSLTPSESTVDDLSTSAAPAMPPLDQTQDASLQPQQVEGEKEEREGREGREGAVREERGRKKEPVKRKQVKKVMMEQLSNRTIVVHMTYPLFTMKNL